MAHRARYILALSNSSCSVCTSGFRISLFTCGGTRGLSITSFAVCLVNVVTLLNFSMMFHPVSLTNFINGSMPASLPPWPGPDLGGTPNPLPPSLAPRGLESAATLAPNASWSSAVGSTR